MKITLSGKGDVRNGAERPISRRSQKIIPRLKKILQIQNCGDTIQSEQRKRFDKPKWQGRQKTTNTLKKVFWLSRRFLTIYARAIVISNRFAIPKRYIPSSTIAKGILCPKQGQAGSVRAGKLSNKQLRVEGVQGYYAEKHTKDL